MSTPIRNLPQCAPIQGPSPELITRSVTEPAEHDVVKDDNIIFNTLQKCLMDNPVTKKQELRSLLSHLGINVAGANRDNQDSMKGSIHRRMAVKFQQFHIPFKSESYDGAKLWDVPGEFPSFDLCKQYYNSKKERIYPTHAPRLISGSGVGYVQLNKSSGSYQLEDCTRPQKDSFSDYQHLVVTYREGDYYYALTLDPVASREAEELEQLKGKALDQINGLPETFWKKVEKLLSTKEGLSLFSDLFSYEWGVHRLIYFLGHFQLVDEETKELSDLLGTLSQGGCFDEVTERFLDKALFTIHKDLNHKLVRKALNQKLIVANQRMQQLVEELLKNDQGIAPSVLRQRLKLSLNESNSFETFVAACRGKGVTISSQVANAFRISYNFATEWKEFKFEFEDYFKITVTYDQESQSQIIKGDFIAIDQELIGQLLGKTSPIQNYIFLSGDVIAIDHSLVQEHFTKKNIYLKALRQLAPTGNVTIDPSGVNGTTGASGLAPGNPGSHGASYEQAEPSNPGRNGESGTDGTPGQDGEDGTAGTSSGHVTIDTPNIDTTYGTLTINTSSGSGGRGGNGTSGGKGGNGGHGGPGTRGADGQNGVKGTWVGQEFDSTSGLYKSYWRGARVPTKGALGARGGNGGNAGNGGRAGRGGRGAIPGQRGEVTLPPEMADRVVVIQSQGVAGAVGSNGEPGDPGALGGAGPRGESGNDGHDPGVDLSVKWERRKQTEHSCEGSGGVPLYSTRVTWEPAVPPRNTQPGNRNNDHDRTHNQDDQEENQPGVEGREGATPDAPEERLETERMDAIGTVPSEVIAQNPVEATRIFTSRQSEIARLEEENRSLEAEIQSTKQVVQHLKGLMKRSHQRTRIPGNTEGALFRTTLDQTTLSKGDVAKLNLTDAASYAEKIREFGNARDLAAVQSLYAEAAKAGAVNTQVRLARLDVAAKLKRVDEVYRMMNELRQNEEFDATVLLAQATALVEAGRASDVRVLVAFAKKQGASEELLARIEDAVDVAKAKEELGERQQHRTGGRANRFAKARVHLSDNLTKPAHFSVVISAKEAQSEYRKQKRHVAAMKSSAKSQSQIQDFLENPETSNKFFGPFQSEDREQRQRLSLACKKFQEFGGDLKQVLPYLKLVIGCEQDNGAGTILIDKLVALREQDPSNERRLLITDSIKNFALQASSLGYDAEELQKYKDLPIGVWPSALRLDYCQRDVQRRHSKMRREEQEQLAYLVQAFESRYGVGKWRRLKSKKRRYHRECAILNCLLLRRPNLADPKILEYIKDGRPVGVITHYLDSQRKTDALTTQELVEQMEDKNPLLVHRVQAVRARYSATFGAVSDGQPGSKEERKQLNQQLNDYLTEHGYLTKFRNGGEAPTSEEYTELAAAICRGIRINKGHMPRDTQIIALLKYMDAWRAERGLIEQISTGEGKSDVNIMTATFFALLGQNVNLITSSPNLAIRDSEDEEYRSFFRAFGLEVGNNCDQAALYSKDKLRERYKRCHIMYGRPSDFERDHLRTRFFKDEITSVRPFAQENQVAIVDEADNAILDNGGFTLYLSQDDPDFVHLESLVVAVWQNVVSLAKGMGSCSADDISPLVATAILKKLDSGELILPHNMRMFAEQHMSIWVESALKALDFRENDDYILQPDSNGYLNAVVIAKDSGVEQPSTQWTDMLHQFLQLKHNINGSVPSLMSVYQSNISFFTSFGSRLYGLTGTAGTKEERSLLTDIYGVDFCAIPRFKEQQLEQLPAQVCANQEEWLQQVGCSVQDKRVRQAVLVLCETIEEAELVTKRLRAQKIPVKKTYTLSANMDAEIPKAEVGDVIVATYIAGRGADMGVKMISAPDGYHSIMASLALNERVELQGFGRAARKGEKGSCEYIINGEAADKTITELRYRRDLENLCLLEEVRTKCFPENEVFKRAYREFEQLNDEVSKLLKENEKLVGKDTSVYTNDLNQRWAYLIAEVTLVLNEPILWEGDLQKKQLFINDRIRTFKETYLNSIREAIAKKKPQEALESLTETQRAGHQLVQNKEYKRALETFEQAISKNPKLASISYYYSGFAKLLTEGNSTDSRKEAKKLFKSALEIINRQISQILEDRNTVAQLHNFCGVGEQQPNGNPEQPAENAFQLQVNRKIQVLNSFASSITSVIGEDFQLEELVKLGMEQGKAEEALRLLTEKGIVKPERISRKITTSEGAKTIACGSKKASFTMLSGSCWTKISKFLLGKASERAANSRSVAQSDIEGLITTTKSSVWNRLIAEGYLQVQPDDFFVFSSKLKVDLSGEALKIGEMTIPLSVCDHVEALLADKVAERESCTKAELREAASSLNDQEFVALMEHLIGEKAMMRKAKLSEKSGSREAFEGTLKELFQIELPGEAFAEEEGVLYLLREGFPLPETPKDGAKEVWTRLCEIGAVKRPRVKAGWDGSIKKKLDKIQEEFGGDDFKTVRAQLSQFLKSHTGDLRMFAKFKTESTFFQDYLAESLEKGEVNPEGALLMQQGLETILSLKEVTPPWAAIGAMLLGAIQIVAGAVIMACLSATGVGAVAGMFIARFLINEGCNDLISGTMGLASGNFTWDDYKNEKLASMATSAVMVGGAAAVGRAVKFVKKAKQVKTGAEAATKVADKTKKQAQVVNKLRVRMAGMDPMDRVRQVTTYCGKKIGGALLVAGVNVSIDKAIGWLMERIMTQIRENVERNCLSNPEDPEILKLKNEFRRIYLYAASPQHAKNEVDRLIQEMRQNFLEGDIFKDPILSGCQRNLSGSFSDLSSFAKDQGKMKYAKKMEVATKVARVIIDVVKTAKILALPTAAPLILGGKVDAIVQASSKEPAEGDVVPEAFLSESIKQFRVMQTAEVLQALEQNVLRGILQRKCVKAAKAQVKRVGQWVARYRAMGRLDRIESGEKMPGFQEFATALRLDKMGVALLTDKGGEPVVDQRLRQQADAYTQKTLGQSLPSDEGIRLGLKVVDQHYTPCIKNDQGKWEPVELKNLNNLVKNGCMFQSLLLLSAYQKAEGTPSERLKAAKKTANSPEELFLSRKQFIDQARADARYLESHMNNDHRRWRKQAKGGVKAAQLDSTQKAVGYEVKKLANATYTSKHVQKTLRVQNIFKKMSSQFKEALTKDETQKEKCRLLFKELNIKSISLVVEGSVVTGFKGLQKGSEPQAGQPAARVPFADAPSFGRYTTPPRSTAQQKEQAKADGFKEGDWYRYKTGDSSGAIKPGFDVDLAVKVTFQSNINEQAIRDDVRIRGKDKASGRIQSAYSDEYNDLAKAFAKDKITVPKDDKALRLRSKDYYEKAVMKRVSDLCVPLFEKMVKAGELSDEGFCDSDMVKFVPPSTDATQVPVAKLRIADKRGQEASSFEKLMGTKRSEEGLGQKSGMSRADFNKRVTSCASAVPPNEIETFVNRVFDQHLELFSLSSQEVA